MLVKLVKFFFKLAAVGCSKRVKVDGGLFELVNKLINCGAGDVSDRLRQCVDLLFRWVKYCDEGLAAVELRKRAQCVGDLLALYIISMTPCYIRLNYEESAEYKPYSRLPYIEISRLIHGEA